MRNILKQQKLYNAFIMDRNIENKIYVLQMKYLSWTEIVSSDI